MPRKVKPCEAALEDLHDLWLARLWAHTTVAQRNEMVDLMWQGVSVNGIADRYGLAPVWVCRLEAELKIQTLTWDNVSKQLIVFVPGSVHRPVYNLEQVPRMSIKKGHPG